MAVTLFSILSWLVITGFIFMKKSLSFMENAVVYMVTEMVVTSVWTLLTLDYAWVDYTKQSMPFTAFLLKREFLLPFIVLIFVNLFLSVKKRLRVFVFAVSITSMFFMDWLCSFLGVAHYHSQWPLWAMLFIDAGYLFIGLGCIALVHHLEKRRRLT